MITLKIDTSSREEIILALSINGKKNEIRRKINKGSEMLIPLIRQILSENKIKIDQIDEVIVSEGPGSYTGLRVGVSVANALSKFLNIPINNKPPGKIVEPIYK
jgi:tRNA threonylcarbamoyladenosine biosynthesis protein TsaB